MSDPDEETAETARGALTELAWQLVELHEQAVDPRLRALIGGATDTLVDLAATLDEHTNQLAKR